MSSTVARIGLVSFIAFGLVGCGAVDRIGQIGKAPSMSAIQNPVSASDYQPVKLPMPPEELHVREANSLWRSGSRAFFKDQRAARIGDILTVTIDINDNATLDNETKRSRANSENTGINSIMGFERHLQRILPSTSNPASLIDASSTSSSDGSGSVGRSEAVSTTVAAVVTQVLPNGNLVIQGRQEVRVNFELRELLVAGVVRPEDISSANTIKHTQIAEARISYGGRGQITDVQQPRYGQQLFDIISPF
jgi:flagellar L-ring protein precursor FlgH